MQAICIQRDRLTGVLLEAARAYTNIQIDHNTAVGAISWEGGAPEVRVVSSVDVPRVGVEGSVQAQPPREVMETIWPDLLVGADGFNSDVAKALEEERAGAGDFKIVRFKDSNTRLYKTIPLDYDIGENPDFFRRDLNFSASSRNGAEVTLEVL